MFRVAFKALMCNADSTVGFLFDDFDCREEII